MEPISKAKICCLLVVKDFGVLLYALLKNVLPDRQDRLENLWGLGQMKNVGPLYITDIASLQALACVCIDKGGWGLAPRKILKIRPSEIKYESDFSSLSQ